MSFKEVEFSNSFEILILIVDSMVGQVNGLFKPKLNQSLLWQLNLFSNFILRRLKKGRLQQRFYVSKDPSLSLNLPSLVVILVSLYFTQRVYPAMLKETLRARTCLYLKKTSGLTYISMIMNSSLLFS